MALVDVLDFLPKNHPRRQELIAIFKDVAATTLNARDKKTHVWYQVLDQGTREGNYLEASASCMFTYAYAKGAHKGYIGRKYLRAAKESFEGIKKQFISISTKGYIDLLHTCQGAGLGGNPYRDGSYEYYIGERQRTNDMKGYGPLLLAAIELEK
jgi:unsaturated rhamnogalacturonyl hydrolase